MRATMQILFSTLALLLFSGVQAGEVSRALFTIGIDNREPVIMVDSISSESYRSISFFTELNGMGGTNITHQWVYNDKVMFEKSFQVKGDRWRVWTSKTLLPGWTGLWTVNVLDEDRSVLTSKTFDYQ